MLAIQNRKRQDHLNKELPTHTSDTSFKRISEHNTSKLLKKNHQIGTFILKFPRNFDVPFYLRHSKNSGQVSTFFRASRTLKESEKRTKLNNRLEIEPPYDS